ncbi:hypothetical protein ACOSP7_016679 [Xanthoceras sorbifolium]
MKIAATKQGNRTVTEYSNNLQGLWQEMDHYQCIQMKCSEDAVRLKRFVEKDRTYDFLAGLNMEFDEVQVQVLSKEELSSLNETISIILAEEGRRGVMVENTTVESSTLVSKIASGKKATIEQSSIEESKQPDQSKPFNRDYLWCTYCKKPRHTKERYFKLHGRPPTLVKNGTERSGQGRGQGQAHMVEAQCTSRIQQKGD